MDIEKLVKAYKKEKDRSVADRMLLIIFIQRDEMSVTGAARRLNKARSWGVKWHRRYLEDGTDGLRDRPRPGRPPKVHKGVMKKIRRLITKTACWEAEGVQSFIKKMTGVEYNLTYVSEMMRKWGFSMKVPVMRHVNRAGNRKIARFKKRMRKILETAGKEWTVGVEDESIVVADSRPRRGVYTLGRRRAVYTYNGSHTKTIVFGFITVDGGGFFKRYATFTKEEFVDFLEAVHKWFGKTIMVLDGASQHRAKIVRETLREMNGEVRLVFLPPGCPDLNAIEEVWRQMKHAVLDAPTVKLHKMCEDIDKWLVESLPRLEIENYLYRKV